MIESSIQSAQGAEAEPPASASSLSQSDGDAAEAAAPEFDMLSQNSVSSDGDTPAAPRQASATDASAPDKQGHAGAGMLDPILLRSMQRRLEQQRKSFAATVAQNFEAKVSGRMLCPQDPAPSGAPLTVQQQVHELVGQATSLDRLAQMYEGWTAWI